MAKYKKEIEEILRKAFTNLGLDKVETFEDFVSGMFEETGTSYEMMSKELEIGIKNGFTLENQLLMMEATLIPKTNKPEDKIFERIHVEDWMEFGQQKDVNGNFFYDEFIDFLMPKQDLSLVEKLMPIMEHYYRNHDFYRNPKWENVLEGIIITITEIHTQKNYE